MRLLESPLLRGVRHGFSTRNGGVSAGRFASLNVGARWGDVRERVEENRRLVAHDGGFEWPELAFVRQVHSARCLSVDARQPASLVDEEADALVATEPGRVVGVFTADCVPILYADDAGRIAAAHAGWRGTVAGIAAVTVRELIGHGARPERLRVALGPSIGPCCFEVGEEVAAEFDQVAAGDAAVVVRRPDRKPHVDLRRANRIVLERAGVPADRIDAQPPCTHCDADRFFSYRRDGAGIGQMLSFVVAGSKIASAIS